MTTNDAVTPSLADMTPRQRSAWVRFQLAMKGESLAAISRRLGLAPQTAQEALRRPYPRVELEIARVIGVAPAAIWPERYGAHDKSEGARREAS